MRWITELSLRHRVWVFAVWGAMLVAGGALSGAARDALSFDVSLPGQRGYETDVEIRRTYGNGGSVPPLIPVVTVPEGQTVTARRADVDAVFTAVARQVPGVRVVDHARTGDRMFLGEDGRSAFALVYTPPAQGLDTAGPAAAAVEQVLRR
ncbi:MAG TPA: hypothetical protein VFY17_08140, partial [Pilimelia sp.]|nr:hypothetical protein [Pilimelia sp.]